MTKLKAYWKAESGSSLIEYALIASCVSAGLVGSVDFVSGLAESPLSDMNTAITVYVDDETNDFLTSDDVVRLSMNAMGLGVSD